MEGETEKTPQPERNDQAERLVEFLHKIKAEAVFDNDKNKVEFIRGLTFDEFKAWLERINGILRDKTINEREMDGKNVEIQGVLLGSEYTPPQHEDKEALLQEVFEEIQKMDNMQDVALLLSSAITAIHPFMDGNGRTSRLAFVLFNNSYEGALEQDEKLKELMGDDGRYKLNTSSVLVDHFIGLEIYTEAGLDIEDKAIAKNLFPHWKQVQKLNTHLAEEEYKTLVNMEKDSFDQFIAVYTYLKNKGVLDKYTKPIYQDDRLLRTVIDLKVLVPDLTADDLKGVEETYWNLKKKKIEKLVDIFVNPQQHMLPEDQKSDTEKGKDITLKERFKEEVLSTMKD